MTKSQIKPSYIVVSFFVLALSIALLISPDVYMKSVLNGILLWGTAVLPALFPFFFFTKLLTELQVVDVLAVRLEWLMRKLYNVPGVTSYAFCLSMLSGYPIGAKLVSELYEKQALSKGAVYRTVAFTSTSGPLFVIGTVGVGMFASKLAGIIILVSHLISALLNGLVWRKFKLDKNETTPNMKTTPRDLGKVLSDSIYSSITSVLVVGGYIALFFMAIDVLNNLHVLSALADGLGFCLNFLGLPGNVASGIASGIIEITRGCFDLNKSGASIGVIIVAATAIISWGGFSIHLQALTFLKKCGINMGIYFTQKLTHCLISIVTSTLCVLLFGLL